MQRVLLSATLTALGVTVVLAQAPASHGATHDPDKKVMGGGTLPSGTMAIDHNLNLHVEGFALTAR